MTVFRAVNRSTKGPGMGGMESGSEGVEPGGAERNFEYLQLQDQQRSFEDAQRSLGRTALESAGIHEPTEGATSPEVYQSLGQTAVKNF